MIIDETIEIIVKQPKIYKKLGYDVTKKTNKVEYSNARFVIANHFLPYNSNKKDNIPLTICESVLKISHATVLHGVKID